MSYSNLRKYRVPFLGVSWWDISIEYFTKKQYVFIEFLFLINSFVLYWDDKSVYIVQKRFVSYFAQ